MRSFLEEDDEYVDDVSGGLSLTAFTKDASSTWWPLPRVRGHQPKPSASTKGWHRRSVPKSIFAQLSSNSKPITGLRKRSCI